ncbi:MAG: hypothetical protein J0H98_11835 [Solirubrobacterales bacterium]|nr:hypothetical protein [Solirubrobacterales bacterium]
MVSEPPDQTEHLERELTCGRDLLASLSVSDRIHFRTAVNRLSLAIDEIRSEHDSIERTDPAFQPGPRLAAQVDRLENLRLWLVFAVVFGEFELLDDGRTGDDKASDGNIYRDGVALAHARLFDVS